MSKILKFAGVSRVAGVLKFRTAADEKRVFQLEKLGDTDINIVAIDPAVTKAEAALNLLSMLFMSDNEEVSALLRSIATGDKPAKAPKAKKEVTVKVKAPKAKKSKSSEPRELSARELAALQFISFPVSNGGRAMYPNPLMKVSAAEDEAV